MNRDLDPRIPDPGAGFDPVHHTSHHLLGGLARCPDLKYVLENSHIPEMKRNAVIALANIGTAEAMDILRRYTDVVSDNPGKLEESQRHI